MTIMEIMILNEGVGEGRGGGGAGDGHICLQSFGSSAIMVLPA